jgi:hypothetical protein
MKKKELGSCSVGLAVIIENVLPIDKYHMSSQLIKEERKGIIQFKNGAHKTCDVYFPLSNILEVLPFNLEVKVIPNQYHLLFKNGVSQTILSFCNVPQLVTERVGESHVIVSDSQDNQSILINLSELCFIEKVN